MLGDQPSVIDYEENKSDSDEPSPDIFEKKKKKKKNKKKIWKSYTS